MAASRYGFSPRPHPPYPADLHGHGLELRPWDTSLVRQMGQWGQRGFPYHVFDLGHLRDATRASSALAWSGEETRHRHFVAVEHGAAVGRVSINLEDDNGLYIWAVHVPPEHEGRGIARRMLVTLMTWLEGEAPGFDFVLTTNSFAERAHRAYFALGFQTVDTRWVNDDALTRSMWQVSPEQRRQVADHVRFFDGSWQVRQHLMNRRQGAPMHLNALAPGPLVASASSQSVR